MRLFIVFYIVFFAIAASSADSDSESECVLTQPYDSGLEEGEIISLALLSDDEVRQDLMDNLSVRCQAFENLSLQFTFEKIFPTIAHPILCIGTGKAGGRLRFVHVRSTVIRENDISIDSSIRVDPHHVHDAFEDLNILEIYGEQTFGIVFFAHVSNQIIGLKSPNVQHAFRRYFLSLVCGGYLIFNSEVYLSCEQVLKESCMELSSLLDAWRSLLEPLGFVAVELVEKSEEKYYGDHAGSFLLIAQKPK